MFAPQIKKPPKGGFLRAQWPPEILALLVLTYKAFALSSISAYVFDVILQSAGYSFDPVSFLAQVDKSSRTLSE
jgi:hypothetical protein